jgi:hypothetical protein
MSRTVQTLLVAAGLTVAPWGVHASIGAPTEAEWRRVLAGEFVTHPQWEQNGELSLIGGTAWMRIDAPADEVWQVVVQPQLYRHLLPYAIDAMPLEQDVVIRHKVILGHVAYRLHFEPHDDARVLKFWVPTAWGALRAGAGELRVTPVDERSCVVTWSIMAHPDVGFVGKLFSGAVQRAMLDVPKLLRRFIAQRALRVAAAA